MELLDGVLKLAIEAGDIIRSFDNKTYHLKKDHSPITQADLASNAHLMQVLAVLSPHPICSEESILAYEKRKHLEYYWLIDPLDGTRDFLSGSGDFCINIALMHHNIPVLGVIVAPYFKKAYFASKGMGAYEVCTHSFDATKKFSQPLIPRLPHQRLIACDSAQHSAQKTKDFCAHYQLDVLRMGSALKICALADGRADLYPRFNGSKEWDIAAGDIILRESGGVIIDLISKKPLIYNKECLQNEHFIAFSKYQLGGKIYHDCIV